MTAFTRCGTCGALSAPWSVGHAPHCEKYQPPKSARLCPICRYPVAVRYVRIGPPAEVEFYCRRGCDVRWIETTEPDDEDGKRR